MYVGLTVGIAHFMSVRSIVRARAKLASVFGCSSRSLLPWAKMLPGNSNGQKNASKNKKGNSCGNGVFATKKQRNKLGMVMTLLVFNVRSIAYLYHDFLQARRKKRGIYR